MPNHETLNFKQIMALCDERFDYSNPKVDLFKFHNIRWNESETLIDWIQRLRPYALASGNGDDEQILNKIIICTSTKEKTRAKAMEPLMTLKKLVEWQHMRDMKKEFDNEVASQAATSLNRVEFKPRRSSTSETQSYKPTRYTQRSYSQNKSSASQNKNNKCRNCGDKYPHEKQCPAQGDKCHGCQKMGHWLKMCRKKSDQKLNRIVASPTNAHDTSSSGSLAQIRIQTIGTLNRKRQNCPRVQICVGNNNLVDHIADTGSLFNIMSVKSYNQHKIKPNLKKSTAQLLVFDSEKPLKIIGEFKTPITLMHEANYGKTINVSYIVVDSQSSRTDNLLGYDTLCELDVDFNILLKPTAEASMLNQIKIESQHEKIERSKLPEFVKKNWKVLFRNETGNVPGVRVKYDENNEINPTRVPSRKIPLHLMRPVKEKLDNWCKQRIAEPLPPGTTVTWCSALNPIEKESAKHKHPDQLTADDVRITLDMRNVNKAILHKPRGPMPNQDSIRYDLNNALVFSKIDIKDAFSTIDLHPDSLHLTVFSTPWGLYRLLRLSQGTNVCSEEYQDIIASLFAHCQYTKKNIDDMLAYGKPDDAHLGKSSALESATINHNKELFKVLNTCERNNMTLNQEKCKFGVLDVDYFGHNISATGFKPLDTKIKEFLETRAPQNKAELESFSGFATYFSERIPDLANARGPFKHLIKKHAQYKWTEIENNAFIKLKNSMYTGALSHFNIKHKTILFVDAGPHGVSAILTQTNPSTNEKHLISCSAHAFTQAEENYAQNDKEAFAVTWGVLKYEHYLINSPEFIINTDNRAVQIIFDKNKPAKKQTPQRLISWRSKLSQFNYDIRLVSGKKNIADFMSRCHNKMPTSNATELETIYYLKQIDQQVNNSINTVITDLKSITAKDIAQASLEDNELNEVIQHLTKQEPLRPANKYAQFINECSLTNDNMVCKGDKIVIPKVLQQKIIELAHDGHLGLSKTKSLIRERFYFKNIDSQINDYIFNCLPCQANTRTNSSIPMLPTTLPKAKWNLISIDFSSRLPSNEYLLVAVDERTRYPVMKLTRKLTAESAIAALRVVFKEMGVPQTIKSDNGPAFKSKLFKQFANEMKFVHQKITPVYAPANGLCERQMPLINKAIRTANVKKCNYKTILDAAIKRFRAAKQPTTQFSPNEMMEMPDELPFPSVVKRKPIKQIDQEAESNDRKNKEKMKTFQDNKKHAKELRLNIGDNVLHQWERKTKYDPLYDPKKYKIEAMNGTMILAKRADHSITRNASLLKYVNQIVPQRHYQVMVLTDPLSLAQKVKQFKAAALAKRLAQIDTATTQNTDTTATTQQQKVLPIENAQNEEHNQEANTTKQKASTSSNIIFSETKIEIPLTATQRLNESKKLKSLISKTACETIKRQSQLRLMQLDIMEANEKAEKAKTAAETAALKAADLQLQLATSLLATNQIISPTNTANNFSFSNDQTIIPTGDPKTPTPSPDKQTTTKEPSSNKKLTLLSNKLKIDMVDAPPKDRNTPSGGQTKS